MIIQSTDGAVFGAFTGAQWKESKDFYGTSDSFLYQLSPVTAVYRPKASGQPNYMYCNSYARSKGYDQQAHGVGFGGTVDQPRLFLAETFDYNDNYAGTQDVTYENGPFLPVTETGTYPKHFEVEALEVWGVGGDEVVQQALGAQSKARSIRDAGIRKAKKVDRAAFLDDLRSGVVDSKMFQHRQQIDGVSNAYSFSLLECALLALGSCSIFYLSVSQDREPLANTATVSLLQRADQDLEDRYKNKYEYD